MREFTLPDEPTDVPRVQSLDGSEKVFRYKPTGFHTSWGNWVDEDDTRYAWDEILNEWGGAIELPKSDVEKAVEFFEEKPKDITYGRYLFAEASIHDASKYTQALIDHAKETMK